jgi:HAD superfamily hydrolase (TIGR01490 family)
MVAKQKVAVFDVDGTIFRSSLLIEVVQALIDSGDFPEDARQEFDREHMAWLDREGDYETYIDAVVRAFREHLKGVPFGSLADAGKEVGRMQYKRTYRYTRDLLKDLKSKGYYLLAVSHSPKVVLDEFCPRLGFDKTYGMMYEIGPQDLFTGVVMDEHLIGNKANILKRAVEVENLTLEESVGVGDTESDIPFLELVEQAVCFNPNKKLYRYAKLHDWKVVVERKDVIYEL